MRARDGSGNDDQSGGAAGDQRGFGRAARVAASQRFGERVRGLRIGAGLTEDELGARCGAVGQAISRIERGHPEPRLWQILQMCHGLDVTPDTLLGALVNSLGATAPAEDTGDCNG
jgi:DNA-binding XRE family transcriptional regulator